MEPRWLGRAVSMKRTALMTPNILGNAQSNTDWSRIIPALSVKRGSLSVQGNEMVLTPQSGSSGYVTLDLDFFLPNKSDFTVLMEVISDDDQIERRVLLPRVNVSTDTKGNRAKFTSKDYVPLTFLFRGASPGAVTIDFRFGKGGPIRFKALSVHAATDGLACEFERGVVVVNPSLEDEVFDFTRLFPNRRGFRRLSAPETFAAHGGDVDVEFQPQLWQAMQINNGQFITNTRAVPVLERNALFLIADPILPSGILEVNGFELMGTGSFVSGPAPTPRPPSYPSDPSCSDVWGELCPQWAAAGECYKNKAYMTDNCQRSCNACHPVDAGKGTVVGATPSATCFDRSGHFNCQAWAYEGECLKNRLFMQENCARACNACE
jgi:hypothetical protein